LQSELNFTKRRGRREGPHRGVLKLKGMEKDPRFYKKERKGIRILPLKEVKSGR